MKNNHLSDVDQTPASSPALVRLLNDYHAATEQYSAIVRYLKAAVEVLPKDDCQHLLEFVETAKNHCDRLHYAIENCLGAHRKMA